jgi:hypothetical protein
MVYSVIHGRVLCACATGMVEIIRVTTKSNFICFKVTPLLFTFPLIGDLNCAVEGFRYSHSCGCFFSIFINFYRVLLVQGLSSYIVPILGECCEYWANS